jgi:hypothetical protein
VTVTRVIRDLQSGTEIRRETFATTYQAEAVIRCVAPPPAETGPAGGDGGGPDADSPPAEPAD